MIDFNDKVVWITGASSGIGEALAYELAKHDVKIILSARREEALQRVKDSCPPMSHATIKLLPLDLSKPDTLEAVVNHAIGFFGNIDILVNNAGIGQRSLITETPLETDREVMEVNFFGTISLSKFLLTHFIQRRQGYYVNVTSLTGKFGTPYRSAYAASKHALHGFFDALRAEHWKDNIKVTMICPGFIATNLSSNALTGTRDPSDRAITQYNKKSSEWCARRMIRAMRKQQEEVYIGGKEVLAVYIKRFFPTLFSKIIRKVPVR